MKSNVTFFESLERQSPGDSSVWDVNKVFASDAPMPLQDPKRKAATYYDKDDKVTSLRDGDGKGDKGRAYLHDKSILIQMADQYAAGALPAWVRGSRRKVVMFPLFASERKKRGGGSTKADGRML